jgi:hypothetical protein
VAAYRTVHSFSRGESLGDVASGTTLTVGVDISEQEAVSLLRSGHISAPTTNDTAMSFSDWCGWRRAETSTPTQWVQVIQGFCPASGVTAAVGDIVLIDAQSAEGWIGQGWVVTPAPYDITVTQGPHGGTLFDGSDELYISESVAGVRVQTVAYGGSLAIDCYASPGYNLDVITLDAVPVSPVGTVYTLTNATAIHAVVVTFVAE